MIALLEFLDPGLLASLQDCGRRGFRTLGVPLAGALDAQYLEAANTLVGNAPDAPALEIRIAGPRLKLVEGGPVRVALVGKISAEIIDTEGVRRPLPAQCSALLHGGEVLKVGRSTGTAYLAVSGGFAAQRTLGSCSTFERAGLGGIKGRAPHAGDRIACGVATPGPELRASAPPQHTAGPIRVMPGPQEDHFTQEALCALINEPFLVSPAMDRMGMRLEGPRLTHNALGADIISDGVTPGVIQCPASGAPIILLADGQTTGGYAKIATVIRADLPRLAHLRPGDSLRFCFVTRSEADIARKAARNALEGWRDALETFTPLRPLSTEALLSANLISGVSAGRMQEFS